MRVSGTRLGPIEGDGGNDNTTLENEMDTAAEEGAEAENEIILIEAAEDIVEKAIEIA